MQSFLVTDGEAGQRLDKFLARYLPSLGRNGAYRMLRKKNIVLNGSRADGAEVLQAGDELTFWFSDETFAKFRKGKRNPEAPALDPAWILLERDDVIAINKPPGLLSQKAEPDDISVVEMLRAHLLATGERTEEDFLLYAPGVLQRLDRNTSGLLLAAKTLPAAQLFSELLRNRAIEKHYLALVEGEVREGETVVSYAQREEEANRTILSDEESEGSKRIETAFAPLAVGEDGVTLLDVRLITGRTHQIRAQLAAIGHPIVGDTKYGSTGTRRKEPRQMLHAWKLRFPLDDEMPPGLAGAEICAPLFPDMEKSLRAHKIDLRRD